MNDLSVPEPNIPLLRKAVEWAEAEAAKTDGPSMWDQKWYATETACGTAYCIAGYAVAAQPGFEDASTYTAVIAGDERGWSEHAERLLGITDDEACALFGYDNTIEDVRRAAEGIAARAGERL